MPAHCTGWKATHALARELPEAFVPNSVDTCFLLIQLHGQAEIRDWTDEEGTEVFRRFWMGRRILAAYLESSRRGETRICFLRITPDPTIHTYMVGSSIWQLRRRMESVSSPVEN